MAAKQGSGKPIARRYSPQEKVAAVRMVPTLGAELGAEHGTVQRVATQLGYGIDSVQMQVKRADIDDGHIAGSSSTEARQVRALEQEAHELRRATEMLKREFTAMAPNRLRVTGLTFIPTGAGVAYVCFIIDVPSRTIVWSRCASQLSAEMVLDEMAMARWSRTANSRLSAGPVGTTCNAFTATSATSQLPSSCRRSMLAKPTTLSLWESSSASLHQAYGTSSFRRWTRRVAVTVQLSGDDSVT